MKKNEKIKGQVSVEECKKCPDKKCIGKKLAKSGYEIIICPKR